MPKRRLPAAVHHSVALSPPPFSLLCIMLSFYKAVVLIALLATASNAFAPVARPTIGSSSLQMASTMEPPVRTPETKDRVQEVRERFKQAAADAQAAKGCIAADKGNEWWRTPEEERDVTPDRPLRVLIAGGGVAGLVTAAACHAKGMKVAIFEQASQYAPYGGPIQIQSNALRALERINQEVADEIRTAGTITADRVSGLKIGYKKGVFLGLGKQYEKGDWLVRFDTLQPALQAGLSPTVVVDRPGLGTISLLIK